MDFASLLGVSEVRIVSDSSLKSVEDYFHDGAKWGLSISYALTKPEDRLDSVYLKNLAFCRNEDLLILEGFCFIKYNKNSLSENLDKKLNIGNNKGRLVYLPKGESLKGTSSEESSPADFEISEISNIVDYYNLSMAILKLDDQSYVLPGYSNEPKIHIGIDVVYPLSCEVHTPVMIGNECKFQKYTVIGPNSVLGDKVMIDRNSIVSDSIVYDQTYVGQELEIKEKVVVGNHLINGRTGELIKIVDRILLYSLKDDSNISAMNRVIQIGAVLVLIMMQFLPWVLLYLPLSLVNKRRKCLYILDKQLKLEEHDNPSALSRSWLGALAIRLSLDKFEKYFAVFSGRLMLVGNRFYPNSLRNRKLIQELPSYKPGVFSLAETIAAATPEETEFIELESSNQDSLFDIVSIVLKSLGMRLIHRIIT